MEYAVMTLILVVVSIFVGMTVRGRMQKKFNSLANGLEIIVMDGKNPQADLTGDSDSFDNLVAEAREVGCYSIVITVRLAN